MKLLRVPGDGNCLFSSCGHHLEMKPCCLRRQVARKIRDEPSLLISGLPLSVWIEEAGHDPSTYADYISKSGVMGSGIELAIISILHQRTIEVFQMKDGLVRIAEYFPEFGRSLRLLFTHNHYDVLI